MYETNILADDDFCSKSIYSSKEADRKKEDWSAWAEENLDDEDLQEIKRALRKM